MEVTIDGLVSPTDEGGFALVLADDGGDVIRFVIHDTGIGWLWASLVDERVEITGWVESDSPGVITPIRITV